MHIYTHHTYYISALSESRNDKYPAAMYLYGNLKVIFYTFNIEMTIFLTPPKSVFLKNSSLETAMIIGAYSYRLRYLPMYVVTLHIDFVYANTIPHLSLVSNILVNP